MIKLSAPHYRKCSNKLQTEHETGFIYYFQSFPIIIKKSLYSSETMSVSNPIKKCTEPYLFCPLSGVIQQTAALNRSLHQLLPAALHAEQQVLDQDHVLFLAEVLQMCSCLVQFNDVVPVGVHLCHKHLHKNSTERREV